MKKPEGFVIDSIMDIVLIGAIIAIISSGSSLALLGVAWIVRVGLRWMVYNEVFQTLKYHLDAAKMMLSQTQSTATLNQNWSERKQRHLLSIIAAFVSGNIVEVARLARATEEFELKKELMDILGQLIDE